MILRNNPFQSIYQKCNQGNSRAKLKELPFFPRYIDIELTNRCNFHCLMCPTGTGMVKRKKGTLDNSIFNMILEQIRPNKTPIRFIRWGEPLLHPELFNYIKKLHSIGSIVHINTNGSLMNEEIIEKIIASNLDSIKFSFQGVDKKSYSEMRNIDFFDQLLKIIELVHKKRGNRKKPFIHISTTITYENAQQVSQFKEQANQYADLVTVGRTILEHIDPTKVKLNESAIQTLIELKKQESVVKKHPECPEVFDKLSINWDGTVSACCGDYDHKMLVGNLKSNTLAEIWKNRPMNRYRTLLAEMRHDEITLCSTCYDYHGLQTPGLQKI